MENFEEVRINDNLVIYMTNGGATYKTTIVAMNSGHEQRNSVWEYPRWEAELGDRNVTESEAKELRDFFNAMGGQACGFRCKDWLDFQDDGLGILGKTGKGDDTATVFQMYKRYVTGTRARLRIISKPVLNSVKVYKNGVQLSGVTINYTTGIATLPTAPLTTDTITWTGEFDIPVRFATDKFEAQFIAATPTGDYDTNGAAILGDKIFYMKSLPVIEVRL
jgi:uncharacterized protein (TIGR02217 family)